jgi:hypothetical protein
VALAAIALGLLSGPGNGMAQAIVPVVDLGDHVWASEDGRGWGAVGLRGEDRLGAINRAGKVVFTSPSGLPGTISGWTGPFSGQKERLHRPGRQAGLAISREGMNSKGLLS